VPEQRRSRQSLQSLRNPSSLNVELESSHDLSATDSIPLPTTLRKGKSPVTPWDAMPPPDNQAALPAVPLGSGDVEAGGERRLRHTTSKISLPAMASEGALPEGTAEEESMMEWGPMHPCYPHLNPHVVESDPKYVTTRIVRVPRDWMVKGDLAVTFANVYPEVLDGLVTEEEFRDVLRHINEEMMAAFDPFSWHSFVDTVLGIATFWLYDWTGLSFHKRKLKALDAWIARWNHDVGAKNDVEIISLLRSSYMSVCDIVRSPCARRTNGDRLISKSQIRNSVPTQCRGQRLAPMKHLNLRLSSHLSSQRNLCSSRRRTLTPQLLAQIRQWHRRKRQRRARNCHKMYLYSDAFLFLIHLRGVGGLYCAIALRWVLDVVTLLCFGIADTPGWSFGCYGLALFAYR